MNDYADVYCPVSRIKNEGVESLKSVGSQQPLLKHISLRVVTEGIFTTRFSQKSKRTENSEKNRKVRNASGV